MRFGLAMVLACACSGSGHVAHPPTPALAAGFSALRWIPAHPTYAIAARSIRDLQQATRDLFGSLGIVIDADVDQLARFLQSVLVVDPMSTEALGAVGIDAEGGVALFSESINPTAVVRLSSAEQLAGFFQQQRERGMKSESIVIGDHEIFSSRLFGGAKISWVVDGEWLWIHITLPFDHDEPDAEWFTHSRTPGAPGWGDDWARAVTDRARLAGFVDLRAIVGKLPAAGRACGPLLAPIGDLTLAVEGGDGAAAVRLSVDTHRALAAAVLPPPEGWDATARSAPLAAQWNLDVSPVVRWAAPCASALGLDAASIESYGVRAARGLLASFDADEPSGTGAVALDLAHPQLVRSLLDRIPLRSTLESPRMFGPYRGSSLAVPLGPTVEYVVTDTQAFAAVGEDLLARAIGRGPGAPTRTVASLDVVPGGLDTHAWQYLASAAHLSARAVQRLQRWRELHLAVTLDRTRLTLEARGNRI